MGIQNIRSYFLFRMITKILGSDVFIKIFSRKSTPPPAGGGVNIFDVTLIASDAICCAEEVCPRFPIQTLDFSLETHKDSLNL